MSYLASITLPLIQTLKTFSSLPTHQLAGHAANFEFWKAEVEHRRMIIANYRERFERLRTGQQEYGKVHGFGNETHFSSFTDLNVVVPITSSLPLRENFTDAERKELLANLDKSFDDFRERLQQENLLS